MPRSAAPFLLASLLASLPAAAQTHPLFADGPAFGGSMVFSLGASPMANPASIPVRGSTVWVGYVDGDSRGKDNSAILDRLQSGDVWKVSGAVTQLQEAPWALRSRAYGLALAEEGKTLGYLREEWNGLWARPDLDIAHRGSSSALALNTTKIEARRAQVDRLVFGGAVPQGDWVTGINLRIERWKYGSQVAALNPDAATGEIPFTDHKAMLDFKEAPQSVTTATLDVGTTWRMVQGIRLGATIQRLVPRRFGDVEEKPQLRAGIQIDMGSMVALALEADTNAAMRMPFPVNQKAQSASLTLTTNAFLTFLVGAERRMFEDASRTSAGVTVLLRTAETQIGVGFQFGDDRPVKGLGWRMAR